MQLRKFLSLSLALSSCLLPLKMTAQQAQPLPTDPAVRIGKLDNGLTYFIRHNENPKDRADFFIAQKVGSILEEDHQAGLAHFLEHMAFNGTKNFPCKNLINYLETIGVRFGYNLNASTGFDKTEYTIMDVPTTRQGIVDSCLLILHDWSNNITLDGKEIDEERGVIHEEWRARRNAQLRLFEAILTKALPGNKYAQRMPIGTMEVVDNFPHEALRDYYKKWYRPDLQGLVIVGDIDVDYVENKIKEMFKDVPAPVNPAERFEIPVDDNDEPIVAIATDAEATTTQLSISFKSDPTPREVRGSIFGLVEDYMKQIIMTAVNERLSEITHKPNAPFLSASAFFSPFMYIAQTKDAFNFAATVREGEADKAMTALVAEIESLRQFGLTKGEYDRARTNVLKQYENQYNERDKRKNNAYANEYSTYFTDGGYIPGIEVEYQTVNAFAPQLPLEAVNQAIAQLIDPAKNAVVTLTGPSKAEAKIPSEANFLAAFKAARQQKVEAKKDEVSDQKLMEQAPKAGKIISEKKDQKFGTTELILSNSIKVYLKSTDFKSNEILMSAVSPGGLLSSKNAPTQATMGSFMNIGGLGNFNAIQLDKVLTGRSASVKPNLSMLSEGLSGKTTVEDMETFFQLIYLQMTANRKDPEAFKATQEKLFNSLKNQEANPMSALMDSVRHTIYGDNPLTKSLKAADIEKINYDQVMSCYQERFADAGDFMFFFVGNIDEAKMKPLIETYLASLPNLKRGDKKNIAQVPAIRTGLIDNKFRKAMDTPTSTIFDLVSGKVEYTLKNDILMEIFSAVMDQVYTATVREKEGGAYSVSAFGGLEQYPQPTAMMQIFFPTDPARAEEMNAIVFAELEKVAKEGPNVEYFNKTVENMNKQYNENLRENSFWLSGMQAYSFEGNDFVSDYLTVLNSLKPADLQKFVADILKQNNRSVVMMSPEAAN